MYEKEYIFIIYFILTMENQCANIKTNTQKYKSPKAKSQIAESKIEQQKNQSHSKIRKESKHYFDSMFFPNQTKDSQPNLQQTKTSNLPNFISQESNFHKFQNAQTSKEDIKKRKQSGYNIIKEDDDSENEKINPKQQENITNLKAKVKLLQHLNKQLKNELQQQRENKKTKQIILQQKILQLEKANHDMDKQLQVKQREIKQLKYEIQNMCTGQQGQIQARNQQIKETYQQLYDILQSSQTDKKKLKQTGKRIEQIEIQLSECRKHRQKQNMVKKTEQFHKEIIKLILQNKKLQFNIKILQKHILILTDLYGKATVGQECLEQIKRKNNMNIKRSQN